MIKSLLIILCIGGISFFYTELDSPSSFFSILLPIINFFVLIALGIWLVLLFHKTGVKQTTTSRDAGGSYGFFDGDGGGGDGGGC